MKKVINGSLYNTETALELGYVEPAGYNRNDFSYFRETLYRTKSGKYFLHGEGHGNSRYGEWRGNTGGWGEQIRPYTPEEARQWAEDNLTADEYSKAFGEPEEASDTKVPLNLSVSAEFKSLLMRLREETGKSISQIIEERFTKKEEATMKAKRTFEEFLKIIHNMTLADYLELNEYQKKALEIEYKDNYK